MLEEQKMSRSELRAKIEVSQSTIVNMGRNEYVSLSVIDKICNVLKCHPLDFLEYTLETHDDEKSELQFLRGDIYYADLGSVEGGARPVVIVQNDVGNKNSSTIIVAPIVNRQMKVLLPTHVMLKQNDTGLTRDSVIITEQLRSIDKSRLKERITALDENYLEKLDFALRVSLKLN